MPPLDELDTQLVADLSAQKEAKETKETGQEPVTEVKSEEGKEEVKVQEAKTFDEAYVKGLRAENAKYRRQLRDTESSIPNIVQSEVQRLLYPQGQQGQGYPQAGQPGQNEAYYDPRVDDIILGNKLAEIKADPYFSELFNETDDEGRTFEEKLLEEAVAKSWPIAELDALVFKMEKEKLLGRVKQKGIDEAYKSMSTKAAASAERNVSSGKNIEEGEVTTIDEAFERAKKEHGVTDFSKLG
jgi:hypothetical protein